MNPSQTSVFRSIALGLGCLLVLELHAQNEFNFHPLKTYSADSKELIDELRSLINEEYSRALRVTPERHREFMRELFYERSKYLVNLVKSRWFIKNDSLETYVSTVLKRLEEGHVVEDRERKILIARSHEVNAICFGRGIYIIPVGILARIKNEGELAFALAHEMSHDEMDHIQSNLLEQADIRIDKKSKEQLKKIASGNLDIDDVQEFRQIVYGVSRHGRVKELQADSMGFVIFNESRYDEKDAVSMLSVLEVAHAPKYDFGAEVFLPLDNEEFPLQPYFFKEQLAIFSEQPPRNLFMLSNDSIKSHPGMRLRKQTLQGYFAGQSHNDKAQRKDFVKAVTTLAEFETVGSARRSMDLDWSMFHALHLLKLYPRDNYLISQISGVLLKVHEVKSENNGVAFASRYTAHYSPMAKLVNNMLYNLTAKEAAEMAFYFLRNPNHFNTEDESHYYLLWRIAEVTDRGDVRDEMAAAYKAKFGKNISALKFPRE